MPDRRIHLGPVPSALALVGAVCAAVGAASHHPSSPVRPSAVLGPASETTARPNIVLMLSDDQSWDGTAVAMHPRLETARDALVETPHLERLAREGMRFSAAYAPAPVCSPTRASLVTGLHPATLHWTRAGPSATARANPRVLPPRSERELSPATFSIAEALDGAGYTSAHFGKWHLGSVGPEGHGFDASDGPIGNEAASRFRDPNPVDIVGMAARADAFMSAAHAEGRPFFVQLSWLALHAPENARAATIARYAGGREADRRVMRRALTDDLDDGVGRVLATLDRLGIAENTIVIYVSDNGGAGGARGAASPRPLRGGKGSLREGGVRVPMIVRGPGVEAGSWSHERVVAWDLYPTFCELAGVDDLPGDLAARLPGGSLVPILRGVPDATVERSRPEIVFHFPHYQGPEGPHSTIVDGDLKLLYRYEDGGVELHDLATDIGETVDLASEMPATAEALLARLRAILVELDARVPTVNAGYDPSQPTTAGETRPRAGRDDGAGGTERRRRGSSRL